MPGGLPPGTCPAAGVGHSDLKPATPRPNRQAERSHRIGGAEFCRQLTGVVTGDTALFHDQLHQWQDLCTHHRPPGSPGGQAPCQRPRHKTTATAPE
jgi:hypothetical protein